jgi:hypothetical protein
MLRIAFHVTFTLHATERRQTLLLGVSSAASSSGSNTNSWNSEQAGGSGPHRPGGENRLSWLVRHVDCAQRHPWQRMMFGESKDWREEIVQNRSPCVATATRQYDLRTG